MRLFRTDLRRMSDEAFWMSILLCLFGAASCVVTLSCFGFACSADFAHVDTAST